jgi:hypothetical protein
MVDTAGGPVLEEVALTGATPEEQAEEASLLAQSGCQLEHDRRGRSPLFYASSGGRVKCVQLLVALRPAWINTTDADGNTAVAAACANGHNEVALQLLSSGADPSAANGRGLTPAHVAKTPGLLEMLGQYGAALEARDTEGRTALFVACALGRRRAAEMLLEMDTTMTILEDPDARGDRPLVAAAANGHRSVVRLLLGHGAEWDGCNGRGLIAEDVARLNDHGSVYRLLRRVRVADEKAAEAKQAQSGHYPGHEHSGAVTGGKEAAKQSGVINASALVHYTDTLLSPTPTAPPSMPPGSQAQEAVSDLFSAERVQHWAGGESATAAGNDAQAYPAGYDDPAMHSGHAYEEIVDWSVTVLASSGPWAAFWDPDNQACYYVHGPTGASQWELPTDGHGPNLEAGLQASGTV